MKNCSEQVDFERLMELAMAKWESLCPEYVAYFKN